MDLLHFLCCVLLFLDGETSLGTDQEDSRCTGYDKATLNVKAGEALLLVPKPLSGTSFDPSWFSWYLANVPNAPFSSSEEERVHHHGHALLFLNLSILDTGNYVCRFNQSGRCKRFFIQVDVFPAPLVNQTFFTPIINSDSMVKIPCPDLVTDLCRDQEGNLTWYKNSSLLLGKVDSPLQVQNVKQADEALYTCRCTWRHKNKQLYSTASRFFKREPNPVAFFQPQIIAPIEKELFVDLGSTVNITCSASCGKNVERHCRVQWWVDDHRLKKGDGFKETFTKEVEKPSRQSVFSSVLTISQVSTQHFQRQFRCFASNMFNEMDFILLNLKPRASLTPLVLIIVGITLLCLFVAGAVWFFAVDLALVARRFLRLGCRDGGMVYDAYVVYQTQHHDLDQDQDQDPDQEMPMEARLISFFIKALGSVLEDKCGYRLFIQGRDDLPGQDRLELVEACMSLSRRLIVVLTPQMGWGSEVNDQVCHTPKITAVGGYDWQVGLHQALVQTELKVILIQVGEVGPRGFQHLPPGLQLLLRRSSPLRWQEVSRGAADWNSRFWKRVRYMMPAAPARSQGSAGRGLTPCRPAAVLSV